MSKGKPIGIVSLVNKNSDISFRGRFIEGQRDGKCILKENGKEYYCYYSFGFETRRERIFQGVRIMIIGIFLSFFIFF
jgi:hypothetical protein